MRPALKILMFHVEQEQEKSAVFSTAPCLSELGSAHHGEELGLSRIWCNLNFNWSLVARS